MIKNTISYAGINILTVYHKGLDEDVKNRHLKIVEKIGRYKLIFEEKVVLNEEVENIPYNVWKKTGLLGKDDVLNPYGDRACAFVEQIISLDKPRCLFSNDREFYSLKVSIQTFQKICVFTKRYIGIDLSKAPLSFGNIFIYEYSSRDYRSYKEEGIVFKNENPNDTIIIRFKKDKLIVSTKIVYASNYPQGEDIIILSTDVWNNHDIEIYNSGNLVYFNRDTYYLWNLKVNATINHRVDTIPLKNLGKEFQISNQSEEKILINASDKPMEEMKIERSQSQICRALEETETLDTFVFIKPKEIIKAMEFIKKELEEPCKEIWFFDSYFSDRNGINYAQDLIRIFAFCRAEQKNIVFHNSPKKPEHNPISPEEFSIIAKQDSVIKSKKGEEPLKINFCQTKQRIHDRFLFIIDEEGFVTGVTIGTSLNSLNSNYFCMYKLNKGTARHVFEELKKFAAIPHVIEKVTV